MAKSPVKQKPRANVLIGRNVWWYPMADRSVGPRAALVTGPAKEHRDGLLSLAIWEENARTPRLEQHVRHIDDPMLETHPRMKEQGAWEAMPASPPSVDEKQG